MTCACGCGAAITSRRISPSTGQRVRYRPGHNQRGKGKYGSDWESHRKEYSKRWREDNPGKTRQYYLKTRYGISPETYDAMMAEQGGKCAICRRKKRLVVDHNHYTGKVRGLLCDLCNTGIGKLRDDSSRLRKAADYLDKYDVARAPGV